MLQQLYQDLQKLSDPVRAKHSLRFFKTGPGEYGEGDKFYGLTTPQCRDLAQKYRDLTLPDLDQLIQGQYHEQRTIAIIILKHLFVISDGRLKRQIFDFYLSHTKFINNWDLVDISAPNIVGGYLLDKDWSILKKLAKSKSTWERRIAIMATFAFIFKGQFQPTFTIAEMLLTDKEDLIHKAVGWMLREVGKRVSQDTEEVFVKKHYKVMPRTMLRYAIERFSKPLYQKYITGKV